MLHLLWEKIKESAMSILPITVIVFVLSFTPMFDMTNIERAVFLICSFILILSMGLFNLGASLAMTPMGEYAGVGLLKTGNAWTFLIATFVMGCLITIAEPDLMVLANQVAGVINRYSLIAFVGIGVGLFLIIAVVKMITHRQLSQILMIAYMSLFALVAILLELGKNQLLPLAFDSGGVTTGPITVPFIMSFGFGIASTIGGRDSNENSFGMVSLSSVGPILVVILLSLFSTGKLDYTLERYSIDEYMTHSDAVIYIVKYFFTYLYEVARALIMILVFFLILQVLVLKLPKTKMIQIFIGTIITLIGLSTFLTAVNIGFFPIGQSIGLQLSHVDNRIVTVFGFIIGMTVVLAEPAIQVLIEQVEEVTAGAVTKKSMLISLSIGVGLSIALSFIRVMCGFSLLFYLVPGYILSLLLSLFVPPMYTSIAFDSGGVASGPMSSTFILPLVVAYCSATNGDSKVLALGFGTVALIAMTPLITIQLLGFRAVAARFLNNRITMKRILAADDNQIVYFNVEY